MPPRIMDLSSPDTEDFKEWRSMRGIGGAAARAIVGVDPWQTQYQLWCRCTYRLDKEEWNDAMRRGTAYESTARKEFEWEYGDEFSEVNLVHHQYPFLRAQIDGWSPDHRTLVEIKVPGEKTHKIALAGKIPEYYIPQLDHELLVSEAEKVGYWSWQPGSGGKLIWHYRDEKRLLQLLNDELVFWELVKSDTPPPMILKDLIVRVDEEWEEAANSYKAASAAAVLVNAQFDAAKKRLIELAEGKSSIGGGVKVLSFERKGAIDYKQASTDLVDILGEKYNFEKHRRKSATITEVQAI